MSESVAAHVDVIWDAPDNVECSPVGGVLWECGL